jgi:glucokinase
MVRYAVEEEEIVAYTALLDRLEDKFNVPTIIEHDASLAAFGERWSGLGATSSAENLVFLCSDSSCGLIIRGELYNGASKCAGELNLNPPEKDTTAKPDKCWESYDYSCCLRSKGIDLGVPETLKKILLQDPEAGSIIREISGGDLEKIDFNMTVEAAEKGDDAAKAALEEAGEYLGVKAAFLVNLFNPEVIVIGRGIEKAGDILLSAVRKSVRKWAYEETMKVTKILPTSLSDEAVAIGAGALVTQDMFIKI